MPRKMPSKEQPDDYETDDFDETETMISRNKPVRPKSAQGYAVRNGIKKSKRRHVTPGRYRCQSAQGLRSGKDLWMNAVKKRQPSLHSNNRSGESPRHKTPIEFWVDTLRKTGTGISTESTRMNTFSGLKSIPEKLYPYLSTTHYLRTAMGIEKPGRYEDQTVLLKPSPGRPTYKSPEEYYDEVLELRKQIAALNHDVATMKTRIRRLEEDNLKKEKEIENLLNPGKNEEIRRVLGDRKPDSGAVIHSLKQKILKLEVQLREREAFCNKLQADIKVTKIEEMKIQMETLYQEIERLQKIMSASSTKIGSENSVKVKALNETILRLNHANERLQQENKSLKEDLHKAVDEVDVKPDLKRDYEDMNRRELLMTISDLEKRASRGDVETDSIVSGTSGRDRDITYSKLVLKGSVEEKLKRLDQHETELLDEVQRLRLIIRRLREERGRKHDDREALPPTPTPRRRSSRDVGSASNSRRPSSGSRRPSVMSEGKTQSVKAFKEKHAAITIQRRWRRRRQDIEQDKKVQQFKENRAAKKIQNGWLHYQYGKHEKETEEAVSMLQAALKGHQSRRLHMNNIANEESLPMTEEEDDDDNVFLIQSSLKGHHARLGQLKHLQLQRFDSYEDENDHYKTKSPGQSRRSSVQRPLSPKGERRRSSAASVHVFTTKYDNKTLNQVDADDDDDDIVF